MLLITLVKVPKITMVICSERHKIMFCLSPILLNYWKSHIASYFSAHKLFFIPQRQEWLEWLVKYARCQMWTLINLNDASKRPDICPGVNINLTALHWSSHRISLANRNSNNCPFHEAFRWTASFVKCLHVILIDIQYPHVSSHPGPLYPLACDHVWPWLKWQHRTTNETRLLITFICRCAMLI